MKDTEVFGDKKFSDLLRDIHEATLLKRGRIDEMILELRRLIEQPSDAVVLAPIIKDYLDVMVRNDEHLVKIAAIVQRMIATEVNNNKGGGLDDLLSDDEKQKLMADAVKELEDEVKKFDANQPASAVPASTP